MTEVGEQRGDAAYTSAPASSYADPGYLDGRKRYPLDTPAHVAAAAGLFAENRDKYAPEQQRKILAAISAARQRHH